VAGVGRVGACDVENDAVAAPISSTCDPQNSRSSGYLTGRVGLDGAPLQDPVGTPLTRRRPDWLTLRLASSWARSAGSAWFGDRRPPRRRGRAYRHDWEQHTNGRSRPIEGAVRLHALAATAAPVRW